MKQRFRQIRLSKDNLKKLWRINSIIEEYQAQGYKLTLRQLYYQLVSRDYVPNSPSEYGKLSKILTEGRMGGEVDWDAIEDRVRVPKRLPLFTDPKEILNAAHDQYRRNPMATQNVYIEVWVEKDALSGVLERVTNKYRINILVNRGYSSVSAMYDSYKRIVEQMLMGNRCYILYLGDHDPSGKDMIRDIDSRLKEFLLEDEELYNHVYGEEELALSSELQDELEGLYYHDEDCYDMTDGDDHKYFLWKNAFVKHHFKIDAIALSWDQIQQYTPPPNPAKIDDPRAKGYIEQYGEYSWEVDALKPQVLNQILTDAIEALIDKSKFTSILYDETIEKIKIKTLINKYDDL